MATIISDRIYTPDDLLRMPDGKRLELIDGRLVEQEKGVLAGRVASLIAGSLVDFIEKHQLGSGFGSELGYRCFPWEPNKIRKPDASFIAAERLTAEMFTAGFADIAPDLAIEVVSPNDPYREVETKVEEYLRAGVRLIWVLNPARQLVRIHRLDGSVSEVSRGGVLSGEEVLPGFTTPVAPLFQLPPGLAVS